MYRQEPALGLDPRGKTHRPYEFGVKVSLATTLNRSRGGQFIAHAKALPGNPYDGHTLATVIPEIETDRREPCPHRRRPRLSWPQRSARPQVQALYLGPETPRHRDRQTRTPPPIGSRTGHRTRQGRAPHGPKLLRRNPRRRRQRRPRRRRIQLQTPARMAGSLVVRNPGRPQLRRHSRQLAQTRLIAFFTADSSASLWLHRRCRLCESGRREREDCTITRAFQRHCPSPSPGSLGPALTKALA